MIKGFDAGIFCSRVFASPGYFAKTGGGYDNAAHRSAEVIQLQMKDVMKKSLYKSVIYGIIIFIVCSSILCDYIHDDQVQKQKDNINAMQNVNDVANFFEETIKSKLNLLKGYQAYIISLEKVSKTLSDELTVVYLDTLLEEDELILNIGIIKDTTMLFVYPEEEADRHQCGFGQSGIEQR